MRISSPSGKRQTLNAIDSQPHVVLAVDSPNNARGRINLRDESHEGGGGGGYGMAITRVFQ